MAAEKGVSDQQQAPAALYPRKDPVPIVQEAGWAPGPVWTGGKSRPHRDSIPDRPARIQSLYRLSYPAYKIIGVVIIKNNKGRYSHFHKLGPLGYFAMGINSERASSFSQRSVTLVEDLSVDHNSHKTVAYRTSK